MARPMEHTHCTLADILAREEEEYIELIEGILTKRETPCTVHQEICGELGRQLANYARGKSCEVYHLPLAVRLFEQQGTRPELVDTMVMPDITVML